MAVVAAFLELGLRDRLPMRDERRGSLYSFERDRLFEALPVALAPSGQSQKSLAWPTRIGSLVRPATERTNGAQVALVAVHGQSPFSMKFAPSQT
jgi:hypothetical protein